MLTATFESAQLVNKRPIGGQPGCPNEHYLCANDLLPCRASPAVPKKSFADIESLKSYDTENDIQNTESINY